MDNHTPSTAYALLTPVEQQAVDDYVQLVSSEAAARGQRIAVALHKPVPAELVRRSRGLFLKPVVRAAITERLCAAAEQQDISPSRVIAEQAAIAFSNMADYVTVGMFGEMSIDLTKCTREQMAAVKSIETLDTPQGRKIKIQLYDKHPALQALQDVMQMPLITEPNRGNVARIAQGDNAEKAYSTLLESMRA